MRYSAVFAAMTLLLWGFSLGASSLGAAGAAASGDAAAGAPDQPQSVIAAISGDPDQPRRHFRVREPARILLIPKQQCPVSRLAPGQPASPHPRRILLEVLAP